MNPVIEGIRSLSLDEMAEVNAGTFTPNTHSKDMYHAIGISTCYHFFDKDEFRFMGQSISYDQANAMVTIARNVLDSLNTDYKGSNAIGYSEKAFIRAFNNQINLVYGVKWNGVPGCDF